MTLPYLPPHPPALDVTRRLPVLRRVAGAPASCHQPGTPAAAVWRHHRERRAGPGKRALVED
jgi:hypothetical protein